MVRQLSWALGADGGTDRVLVPVINWTLRQIDPGIQVLEPSFLKHGGRIRETVSKFAPSVHLVFIHRDAESLSYDDRLEEFPTPLPGQVVPVIPVRMSEAWLLGDGEAIAAAAQNSSAKIDPVDQSYVEGIVDPKGTLEALLVEASGHTTGRRYKMFQRGIVERRVDVANRTRGWSHLLDVPSFMAMVGDIKRVYPYRSCLTTWGD